MTRPDEPFVIRARDLPASETGPADAPPPPDDEPGREPAMVRATTLAARRQGSWASWFWGILTSLLTLMISIATYDYFTSLLTRFPTLGLLGLALAGILAVMLLVQIVRELVAFRRLARIDSFRADAAAALADDDRAKALALSERLERFYAGRPETRWATEALTRQRDGVLDADALIQLTERALFAELDGQARREIESAARTVAGATALIPLALADVVAALSMNRRMIRRIAETYGAHAGFFGSWRLMRSVATHLIATGAVAVGDDLIGSVAGGSALARLSRRFGEGFINGALTARVGIAAIEVCRPLPFAALPRPKVSNLVGRALSGLFATGSQPR
jgi:putative membrane protein